MRHCLEFEPDDDGSGYRGGGKGGRAAARPRARAGGPPKVVDVLRGADEYLEKKMNQVEIMLGFAHAYTYGP